MWWKIHALWKYSLVLLVLALFGGWKDVWKKIVVPVWNTPPPDDDDDDVPPPSSGDPAAEPALP